MPYREKERKKSTFLHIAVICFILFLLAGLLTLSFLWQSLEKYEQSTPKSAMKPIVTALEANDYGLLAKLTSVDTSIFYDDGQYPAYIRGLLGDDLSHLEVFSTSTDEADTSAFQVVSGDKSMTFLVKPQKDGGFTVTQAEIAVLEYTIYAPPHVTVLVNGRALTSSEAVGTPQPTEAFRTIDAAHAPRMTEYRVTGFVEKPEITLQGLTETDYHREAQAKNTVVFTTYPSPEQKKEFTQLAEEISRRYALYVSTDLNFPDVEPLLDSESTLYGMVKRIDRTWYIAHSQPEFLDMQVSDIVTYSADHFTANVSFIFKVTSDKNTVQQYPTTYHLAFYRRSQESGFKLVNLEFAAE